MALEASRAVIYASASVALGAIALYCTFRSTSVCTGCAIESRRVEFQLPLMGVPYFWWTTESATPVSSALNSLGVVPQPHAHQWMFATGVGNGVTCAIGEGRHLVGPYRSPEVARLLLALSQYDRPTLDRIVPHLGNQTFMRGLHMLTHRDTFPTNGFPDQNAFDAWRKSEAYLWDYYVTSPPTEP